MPTIDNNGNIEEFDVNEDDKDVENAKGEDETLEDDEDKDEDDKAEEDEGSEDDDEDDESGEKSDEAKFDKRYTQLKGDTPEEYAKSLEEAYNNSSAEAVKLNRELGELKSKVGNILIAAEKNPELAKQLGLSEGETSTTKPDAAKSTAESYAEQIMNERMETEYKEFTTEHPEVDTDETIRTELLAEVGVQADAYKARTGKIISMKDALSRAWKVLGYDDNTKEDLAVKVKEQAGQGRTQGTSSKGKSSGGKKTEVSQAALDMAKKMGLSEKDVNKYYKP